MLTSSQMLDHQNNPVGDPQTHYITPKTEPQFSPQHSSVLSSPPPYPGSDLQSEAGTVGSDYGVDPMEEDEGRGNKLLSSVHILKSPQKKRVKTLKIQR